ncbi:MAG: hypothetical protein CMJ78_17240 [Planctomycetaceae bacterium]|nr:hypothetical protein [Planctomycetaceae bacterium]
MEPISLNELALVIGAETDFQENTDTTIQRISIDSRSLEPGNLFWAIRGETHDGHDFVDDAFDRGAIAAVVDNVATKLRVDDTLTALWDFSRWYRQRQNALVVGVTGSVGKTTTREMIHAVLSQKLTGTQSPKNFNNHVGLPLSLLDIEQHHEFSAVEMGASAVSEIRDLTNIALPNIGVITAIGEAHLEGFGSVENIVQGKGELLEGLPTDGLAIVPGDIAATDDLARRANCQVIKVGCGPENDLRASDVEVHNERLTFNTLGRAFELNVLGKHHIGSALSAIAVARHVGLTLDEIADGLKQFTPVSGRCHLQLIGSCTVIDDSYNANPTSMKAACRLLRDWRGANKKILVTGDMLELGPSADEAHCELGEQAAKAGIDVLLALGKHAEQVIAGAKQYGFEDSRAQHFDSVERLNEVLSEYLEPNDVVLVKGSRGLRMEQVIWSLGDVARAA